MIWAVRHRQWLSLQWLVSAGGRYLVLGLFAATVITSIVLLLSNRTYRLYFKIDPKTEAHLAECEGCRNRSIGMIWNHISPTPDGVSSIQNHLDACASCQQKVQAIVHEHTQLQSPLGGKSRLGVPVPTQSR